MPYKFLSCGIDEVGRGAIAGPIVVASVSFSCYSSIPYGIQDSKKLTKIKRLLLFNKIKQVAKIGLGIVEANVIDKIGITQSTNLAASKCVSKYMKIKEIFIDGYIKINTNNKVKNIIKGDENYVSIAAASIIAKVTRDLIMIENSKKNSLYQWNKNMGYGTKEHLLAIKNYGITNHHRKTFKIKKLDEI